MLGFLACVFSVLVPIILGLVSLPEVAGAPIFLGGEDTAYGASDESKIQGLRMCVLNPQRLDPGAYRAENWVF